MMIKTSGLLYDDRLRKEVNTLKDFNIDVGIVALEYANEEYTKLIYDDVPVTTIRLQSRKWFSRSKGIWGKVSEMNIKFLYHIFISKPEILWFHNLDMIGLVPIIMALRKSL